MCAGWQASASVYEVCVKGLCDIYGEARPRVALLENDGYVEGGRYRVLRSRSPECSAVPERLEVGVSRRR